MPADWIETVGFQVLFQGWNHGDDVIIAPSVSDEEAAERFPDHVKVKPYLRVTGQPNL